MYLQSTQYAELVNCSFHDNDGTALVVDNTNITLAGNTEFIHNRACGKIVLGGTIIAVSSNLTFTRNTTFLGNSAISGQCPFSGSAIGGGAIYAADTVLSFSGTNNFINNSGNSGGGVIRVHENTVLNFSGTNNFINNSADYGGVILAYENNVLNFSGSSHFINNSAPMGGAIHSETNSTLTFSGIIYFTNNGLNGEVNTFFGYTFGGGGVYLGVKCTLSILPNTTVYWENNHASFGGAIYVADASPASYCPSVATYIPQEECFFKLPGQSLSNGIDVQLVFKNNFAGGAGNVLYGGAIDNCILTGLDSNSYGKVFDMIVHNNDTDDNTTSTISSDPLRICVCENNLPNCTDSQYHFARTVYPGENISSFCGCSWTKKWNSS